MIKRCLFLLFSLSICLNFFSQEKEISTTFSQDGNLYENANIFSKAIAEFNENETCTVLDYLGKDIYKVKYNQLLGFVTIDDLSVTESIMDLYYDYQEKQRNKAIEEKTIRQKRILEIQRKAEQKIKDSITEIENKEQKRLNEIRRKDSIIKAKNEESKRLEAIRIKDSITKVRNEELNRLRLIIIKDSITKAKNDELKRLETIRIKDSITKVKNKERKRLEEIKKRDSIVKAKAEERKRLETIRINDSIAKVRNEEQKRLEEIKKSDSIVKAKAEERKRLEAIRINDSIAKVRNEEQKRLEEIKKRDSIVKAKAEERKRLEAIRIKDSTIKVRNVERKKLEAIRIKDSINKTKNDELKRLEEIRRRDSIAYALNEKNKRLNEIRIIDSIAKAKENKVMLERMTYRNTCHYQINEYDDFYKERIIRTDPYSISSNLTIELYRRKTNLNIFFNLSEDLGCASYLPNNRSSVRVQLENNLTVTFYHSWDIECGNFNFKGRLSNSQIINLKKSPIKSIKFKGTKDSFEITNIDYKEFFINKLKCIE